MPSQTLTNHKQGPAVEPLLGLDKMYVCVVPVYFKLCQCNAGVEHERDGHTGCCVKGLCVLWICAISHSFTPRVKNLTISVSQTQLLNPLNKVKGS